MCIPSMRMNLSFNITSFFSHGNFLPMGDIYSCLTQLRHDEHEKSWNGKKINWKGGIEWAQGHFGKNLCREKSVWRPLEWYFIRLDHCPLSHLPLTSIKTRISWIFFPLRLEEKKWNILIYIWRKKKREIIFP